MVRVKNILGMLRELQKDTYSNPYVQELIHQGEPEDDDIVILYNCYCMPKKWEIDRSSPKPHTRTKTKRK